MIKKIVRILYDPYNNHIEFKISVDTGKTWQDLADTSELLKYQNQECVFSNCIEDIVSLINQYQNSSKEGVCIHFIGTDEDHEVLEQIVQSENEKSKKKGKIVVKKIGSYRSADEAISIIRKAYTRISGEFDDYLPGNVLYDSDSVSSEIGDTISRFNETVSKEIPVCVIGTYSVGKSAFINAIIGSEVLPSNVNACTAKDIKVVAGDNYRITFEYKGKPVSFSVKKGNIQSIGEQNDDINSFMETLRKHCHFAKKSPEEILHDILEAFNENEEVFPESKNIGWNVTIELKFYKSILDQTDCKIVIYDTPGSNNSDIDQMQHRESLEKMMGQQTNALPIFVIDRYQLVSNDNNEVKKLLDDNRKGFANPNCLIVFSKAENIPSSAFDQVIPASFLNWHGKATFLYVCAVGAIGAKKKSTEWLDSEYKDVYDGWKLKYDHNHISLPDYNIIPCERTLDIDLKNSLDDELFATGIPSVENEIKYYVKRYANYKKCVNGQELLKRSMKLVSEKIESQKAELTDTKNKQEKEREKKKNRLIMDLDGVVIRLVNIYPLIKEYDSVLEKYCDTVRPEIERIWYDAQKSGDAKKCIKQHMQDHCQRNLFTVAYESESGIRNRIVTILSQNANAYKEKLQEIVKGKEQDLSEEAQQELGFIFDEIKTPDFVEVSVKGNELLNVFAKITKRINLFEEKYKDSIASNICKQLRGQKGGLFKKDKLGLFAEQCVNQPVKAYNKQVGKWKNEHLDRIKDTLENENYILSQYDSRILELEEQIEDLERRLNNLSDVSDELETVLSVMEGDNNE